MGRVGLVVLLLGLSLEANGAGCPDMTGEYEIDGFHGPIGTSLGCTIYDDRGAQGLTFGPSKMGTKLSIVQKSCHEIEIKSGGKVLTIHPGRSRLFWNKNGFEKRFNVMRDVDILPGSDSLGNLRWEPAVRTEDEVDSVSMTVQNDLSIESITKKGGTSRDFEILHGGCYAKLLHPSKPLRSAKLTHLREAEVILRPLIGRHQMTEVRGRRGDTRNSGNTCEVQIGYAKDRETYYVLIDGAYYEVLVKNSTERISGERDHVLKIDNGILRAKRSNFSAHDFEDVEMRFDSSGRLVHIEVENSRDGRASNVACAASLERAEKNGAPTEAVNEKGSDSDSRRSSF